MGELTIAKSAGFCFGVTRAVNMVYEAIEKENVPIYTYGPIIHNDEVVKDMEKNGLIYREAVPYDARLKRIVATEKAMQYQKLIHQSLEETEDRLTSGISSQDLAVFFRVINQMIRNMS